MLFKKLARLFSPKLKQEPETKREVEMMSNGNVEPLLTATEFAKTLGLNVVECDADDESMNDTIVSMSSGLTSIQSPRKSSYSTLDMNIFIPPPSFSGAKSANSGLEPMNIPYNPRVSTLPPYKSRTAVVPRIRTNSLSVVEPGPHSANSHHISPLIEEAEVQQAGRFLMVTYSNSYYVSKQKKRLGSRFETTSLGRERRFSDVGFLDGNSFNPASL